MKIVRDTFTQNSTIGKMLIDGAFFCYTLEDTIRDTKIAGETAIPYGTYKVIVNMSNRFKRLMPLLLNVPNFEGVRIHNGNTKEHTHGCILVGATKSKDFINDKTQWCQGYYDGGHSVTFNKLRFKHLTM